MVTRKEKLHSVKMYFQCNLILLRQYDRLLHFTINIKKSHRQLQWTLQPVCEDRVLFVWVDLHISLYRQQHQNAVVCIHMNFLLTMTDTITSLSFWITMYIYIYIYIYIYRCTVHSVVYFLHIFYCRQWRRQVPHNTGKWLRWLVTGLVPRKTGFDLM